jgi:hypothetical protein
MGRGIFRIILGLVFIIGGLSGQLALRGTQSGPALAVVGAIILVLGIVTVAKGGAK